MPITEKSDENMRALVLGYIESRKAAAPGYKVLDVGGGANPWCDKFVDAYMDIVQLKTSKTQFTGDINEPGVWAKARGHEFDFSICTHTLEDIRNPGFVMDNLMRISKAGFIAMPNKHTEMSNVESAYWVGYCHHRWIFTVSGEGVLRVLAKLPLSGYFSASNRLAHLLGGVCPGIARPLLRKMRRSPVAPGLGWLDKGKTLPGFELGFIWEKSFRYEFINGDYAGKNVYEAASLYTEQLGPGI